ncbi:MAG: hypothetical protein AAF618_11510 [Pseudomonadota bacterium]
MVVQSLERLFRDEDGAITVEWVAIVALMVFLIVALFATMESGTEDLTGDMDTSMKSILDN